MRTIFTLAAVGMVGVLYAGHVGSDQTGPSRGEASADDSGAEVVMSECIADDRFAELELEPNADGIPVIEGLDPELSPEEAADLLRAIQACIHGEP